MKKKYVILGIMLATILTSSACFYMLKKHVTTSKPANDLKVYTVPATDKVYVNGIITPKASKDIFLDPAKGTLNELVVKDNQAVNKGDLLFTYRNEAISDQIYQLNSEISSTRKQITQLENEQAKTKKDLGSATEIPNTPDALASLNTSSLESFNAQIEPLKAQVSSLEEQVAALKDKEYSNVVAPISGNVILHKESNDPTSPYLTVETTDFYISGTISEKEQPKLKANQSANILILSTNASVKGKVSYVGNRPISAPMSTAAMPNAGGSDVSHYLVNLNFDNQKGLTNGFHVQSTINLSDSSIKIPKTALLGTKDNYYVFKSVDNKIVKQAIKYSKEVDGQLIITNGLKENDTVITNPSKDMKEGIAVE